MSVLFAPTCDEPTVISQSIYKLLEQGPEETRGVNKNFILEQCILPYLWDKYGSVHAENTSNLRLKVQVCVYCVLQLCFLRTLTMQLLMSTKPGLQNLRLWAADTCEKRKI